MKRPFKEDAVRLGSEATSRRSPEDDVFAGPETRRSKDIRVQKTECRAPAVQEKVCRPPARVRQALSAQNFAPSQLPLIPGESLFFFTPICRLPFSPYYKPPARWRLFAAAEPFFFPPHPSSQGNPILFSFRPSPRSSSHSAVFSDSALPPGFFSSVLFFLQAGCVQASRWANLRGEPQAIVTRKAAVEED